ncbi:MAG: MBL fold metallo-hydrolase [Gemmatimonadaceae bacterium]
MQTELLDGITRIIMTTWRSRLVGYSVSAWFARGVLVDTGFPAAAARFAAALDALRPSVVLLTHQHEDHAGNADLVARRGIPLVAAASTLAAIRDPQPMALYRRFCWGAMRPLRTPVSGGMPEGLELIHSPGHSFDHHVVWDAERGVLFAGDLYLGVKVRVARPGENPRALSESLHRIAALQPRRMFDAHRGEVMQPVEALLAKARWLDDTIGRIDQHDDEGRDERMITRSVLGREDIIAVISAGDLARANFVRAVRATRPGRASSASPEQSRPAEAAPRTR